MANAQLLIVDDDRLILHTLSTGLRSAGYRTLEADSGESAIKLAQELPIDLAIIDVRMPGMSGLELAGYLRTHTATPFIFLSAYGDAGIVEQAVAEGALGYLVKPLDVPNIIPSIEAALVRAKELSDLKKTEAHLNAAVNQGRDISIAIGLLMERYGLSKERAFEALRKAARKERRKLEDFAAELISGKADIGISVEIEGKGRPVRKT
jgi:AmiR/NasT family two-component response regulator